VRVAPFLPVGGFDTTNALSPSEFVGRIPVNDGGFRQVSLSVPRGYNSTLSQGSGNLFS